jgi:hypothetical protein
MGLWCVPWLLLTLAQILQGQTPTPLPDFTQLKTFQNDQVGGEGGSWPGSKFGEGGCRLMGTAQGVQEAGPALTRAPVLFSWTPGQTPDLQQNRALNRPSWSPLPFCNPHQSCPSVYVGKLRLPTRVTLSLPDPVQALAPAGIIGIGSVLDRHLGRGWVVGCLGWARVGGTAGPAHHQPCSSRGSGSSSAWQATPSGGRIGPC